MSLSKSFTAAGVSNHLMLAPGESADYSVSGTFTGYVNLEVSSSPTTTFGTLVTGVADTGFTGTI